MKKSLILILALAMTLSMLLAGCGEKKDDTKTPDTTTGDTTKTDDKKDDTKDDTAKDEKTKVALLINGTLGDKSFFDSADNGMTLVNQKFGDAVETKTIEMGYDPSKWEPTLQDISDEDWDIIIVGTWQMLEHLEAIAPEHPEKKYFIFDAAVNYAEEDFSNVYSINFKQNEGAFVAGVLATRVTTSDMELANPEKKIGFLGGMDIPVINDFLVGYIEGAQYADKDVKVAISYIGSFDDSAKGKEMSLAQYNQGVDIGFNVAGQAGLGQLDAAKEVTKYAIGVDSDQAGLFEDDKAKADLILTSVLKRVDQALLRGVEKHIDGSLPYGTEEVLGFKEKAIGIVDTNTAVPAEIMEELKGLEEKIISGEIVVTTAMGLTTEDLDKIRNSVK